MRLILRVALTNKVDGHKTERHKRIEFVMVARHDLARNLLSQYDAETVGKGNPSPGFELSYSQDKFRIHVAALDNTCRRQICKSLTRYRFAMLANKIVVDFQ